MHRTFPVLMLALGFIVGGSLGGAYALGVITFDGDFQLNGDLMCPGCIDVPDMGIQTLGGLTCPDGQIPKFVGGVWVCADDEGGVGVGDNLSGCATNQIMKWDGSQWVCATDNNTTEPGTIQHVTLFDNAVGNAAGWDPDGSSSYGISDPDISASSRVIVFVTTPGGQTLALPSTINTCGGVGFAPLSSNLVLSSCHPQISEGWTLRYTVFNPPTIIFIPPLSP